MSTRLRAAGWRVRTAGPGAAEPRVEIFAPDQSLRWSGQFRGDDLKVAGAVVLDTLVLEKIARGESAAPFVPVGCVTPVASAGRGSGAQGWRNFFQL